MQDFCWLKKKKKKEFSGSKIIGVNTTQNSWTVL